MSDIVIVGAKRTAIGSFLGQFTGVLVAPSADLTLNGGGNSNEDFCGSLMVNSARFNGHFSFHYDESLLNSASNGRYLATSWNEVP